MALGAGAVSSMTVTGSDWEERLHVPGARMLRAAGDHDTLCRAVTSRASIGLSIQALSVLRVGGCTELPSSGCSARGEDVGRWHLLILGSKSHHGDGSRCHRIVPPRTHFHPPAATRHDSDNHQQWEPNGRGQGLDGNCGMVRVGGEQRGCPQGCPWGCPLSWCGCLQ